MRNHHPILIVEDDSDDSELLEYALKEIGVENQVMVFRNGLDALFYLKNTINQTFLIVSDINMPKLNGLQLKAEINKDDQLKRQSIPFVLLSTSATPKDVSKAFEMMVQGFFKKPNKFEDIKMILKKIVTYWDTSCHPNLVWHL